MNNDFYNINCSIEYSNNDEYREQIQSVFLMYIDDIKPETDEILYDGKAISNGMDFVYEKTNNHPLMIQLYQRSSEFLFTENLEIGLAVLFSYDYFQLFHKILVIFFTEPENLKETNTIYIELLNKIQR